MKKLFAIAILAVAFVACNNNEATTEENATPDTAVAATVDTAAAAPAADTTAKVDSAATTAAPAEAAEEQTEFDVILDSAGDKKLQVLKVVRELTGLGLKEAKELVDAAPKPIKEKVKKEEADSLKQKIEAEGGKVSIK